MPNVESREAGTSFQEKKTISVIFVQMWQETGMRLNSDVKLSDLFVPSQSNPRLDSHPPDGWTDFTSKLPFPVQRYVNMILNLAIKAELNTIEDVQNIDIAAFEHKRGFGNKNFRSLMALCGHLGVIDYSAGE